MAILLPERRDAVTVARVIEDLRVGHQIREQLQLGLSVGGGGEISCQCDRRLWLEVCGLHPRPVNE